MLLTQSFLPRALAHWMSQVAASVGATLAVTAIYAALPRPAPVDAPRPELTSGGKFAARAAPPIAYDGLDVMPLPQVTPLVATVTSDRALGLTGVDVTAGTASLHRAMWEGSAPLVLAPDRSGRAAKPGHAPARVDIRRAVPAARRPVIATEPDPAIASVEAPVHEDGLIKSLPKVLPHVLPAALSDLHDAWALTTAAGGALVAHVVPQIP